MGNAEDARILALEQELAGFDSCSEDDEAALKAAKAARKEAKAARKEAKAARKEAKAARKAATAAPAEGSSDAAAAGSADAASVTAPLTTAGMFSVHAGETVHFSGRKPGDPKPKRGAKKRAREAAEAEDAAAPPPPRWRCVLCSIEVNSQDLLEEHRKGWRHAEKVASMAARAAGLYCEVRARPNHQACRRGHCSQLTGRTLAASLHQQSEYAKGDCSRVSLLCTACCAGVFAGLHRAGADGRASQRKPPRSRFARRWKGRQGKGRQGQQGW